MTRNLLRRYGAALGVLGLGVVARLGLDLILPGKVPFLTMFPAVIAAGYFFGSGPGLLVLLAGSAAPFWVWPHESLAVRSGTALGFIVFAGFNLWILLRMQHAHRKLAAQDRRLELLNGELRHRIQNIFAVNVAIIRMTFRLAASPAEVEPVLRDRLQAVAKAQDLLTTVTGASDASLVDIIDGVVRPLSPVPDRLVCSGPPVSMGDKTLAPFALILHELSTNALKYGAWSNTSGRVTIEWLLLPGNLLQFRWKELAGPPVFAPKRTGAGSRLISRGLSASQASHLFEPDGVSFAVTIPL